MAKNRPKPGRPPGRKPSVTVFARIDPALAAVLNQHVTSLRPKTTTTAVVSLALEEYLTRLGLWPGPPPTAPRGTP